MARGGWTGFLSLRDNGAATSLGTLGGAFKSVTDNFKKGFYQNFNLFTLIKKGIDAVVKSAQELIKESREIVTTSTKFNIPISQLGELRYVALQSGLGINGLTNAIAGLRDSFLEGIINPGGEATWMMEKLGIKQGDLIDLSKRTGDGFWKIVDSIRAMSNETDRDIALKAIYKGEWQAVSVIVNKSAEDLQKLKDESHAYETESVKNNEKISQSWDRIGERLKTLGNALAPIMGILAGLVEFLTSAVIVAFHALGLALEKIGLWGTRAFQAIGTEATAAAGKAANALRAITPASGYSWEDMKKDNAQIDKDKAVEHSLDSLEYQTKSKISNDERFMAINQAADGVRSGLTTMYDSGTQVAINAGWKKNRVDTANDDELRDDLKISKLKQEEVREKAIAAKARSERLAKEARGEKAEVTMAEGYEKARLRLIALDIKEIEERKGGRLKELQRFHSKAVFEDGKYKAKTDKPPAAPTIKTLAQTDIDNAQEKAIREQGVKRVEANTDSWDKWKQGVVIAQMQYANAQEDLRKFMESSEKQNVAKRNAFLNAQTNAQINLQAKEKELANLKQIAARDAALADIDRTNKAIEGQQGRDLFGMKMRGVSAIDQQNVVFRNSVDKMKREQAKLEALKNDPMREKEYMGGTGPAAIALKNSIQDLMMSAAGEMDTLMAMQFNYVSSDAAKKGMGGGIAMVNNPLEVAKESRDYLRKIYESMNGTGSFDVVPKYSQGNGGWNMGSNGVQLFGDGVNN